MLDVGESGVGGLLTVVEVVVVGSCGLNLSISKMENRFLFSFFLAKVNPGGAGRER